MSRSFTLAWWVLWRFGLRAPLSSRDLLYVAHELGIAVVRLQGMEHPAYYMEDDGYPIIALRWNATRWQLAHELCHALSEGEPGRIFGFHGAGRVSKEREMDDFARALCGTSPHR